MAKADGASVTLPCVELSLLALQCHWATTGSAATALYLAIEPSTLLQHLSLPLQDPSASDQVSEVPPPAEASTSQ